MLVKFVQLAQYLSIVFILFYSMSLGPAPWILIGEILPAKGVSFTVAFDWCTTALLSTVYRPLANALGDHTMFYFFAACNLFVAFGST